MFRILKTEYFQLWFLYRSTFLLQELNSFKPRKNYQTKTVKKPRKSFSFFLLLIKGTVVNWELASLQDGSLENSLQSL